MTRSALLLTALLLPLAAQRPKDDHKDGKKGDRKDDSRDDRKDDRHEDESFAERRVRELSRRFNLTEAQRAQALSIFNAADSAAEPIEDKLDQARRKLRDSTRRNTTLAELEQLAAPIGPLVSQLEFIEAKAETAFHNTLTAKQREDFRRPPPPPPHRR